MLYVAPVPPPKSMPKLTSALLYKVPGGCSGEIGKKLIRAKEVERRLNIPRSGQNKKMRDARTELKSNASWGVAADALNVLKANDFKLLALKKPQLEALVLSLNVGKHVGNKDALVGLLAARFGNITSAQFDALRLSVQRGVATASLPLPLQPPPPVPALPQPALIALMEAQHTSLAGPMPLAL